MPLAPGAEESRWLDLPDGTRLHYRLRRSDAGAGRAAVLLHGLASNHTRWRDFIRHTALGRTHDLLGLDLRGHGYSSRRVPVGTARWCSDLRHLLDAEGYPAADLIGHCLGANIALHFAADDPQRTRRLVLVEPILRQALRWPLAVVVRLRVVVRPLIAALRGLNRLGLHRRHLPTRDLEALDNDTRRRMASGEKGALLGRYGVPWRDLYYTSVATYLEALIATGDRPPPPWAVKAPTLVLLAAGAAFTVPERTRVWLAELPCAEVVELPARHWIPTEQPERLRLAAERWLAGSSP